MAGTIEIIVKLYLSTDVDEKEAKQIIENTDYYFDHKLIAQTEIVDYELIKTEWEGTRLKELAELHQGIVKEQ